MAREEPGEHGAPTHAPRSQETLRQVELSPQRAANERAGVARVRIVVVDDDRDTTAMMRALLEHAGYDVETAHDGQAALDTIARFQAGTQPTSKGTSTQSKGPGTQDAPIEE